jgi:predicted RNA-binding protein associated with RNAse of E/G family
VSAQVGTAGPDFVEIRYTRPPDRLTVFRQRLVHEDYACIITLMEQTPLDAPALAGGRVILEPGSPVVWFTFPGAWHDIGRFHTAAGEFTGYYANLLTPVRMLGPRVWETTDLFLDVWLDTDGSVLLLDEDELEAALDAGSIVDADAAAARSESTLLVNAARAGSWPPPIAREWTLERARSHARRGS